MIFWFAIAVAGAGLMVMASRKAIHHASALAAGYAIPPFLIGLTLVSLGTDIPEIANSIVASLAGHGDLVVGDSVGSVLTQITLVFGVLPFFTESIRIYSLRTAMIGGFTVAALGIGISLMLDGYLSRLDSMMLIATGIVFTFIAWKFAPRPSEPETPPAVRKFSLIFVVLFFLLLVGAGAAAFVRAFIELSAAFGVPEYLIAFFGASFGTSLPELAVDLTALSRGRKDIAVGDIVGSCLIDSTIAMGAGPLISPIAVTAALAVRGSLIAMLLTATVVSTVSVVRVHNRWTGALCIILYGTAYIFFIAR